MTESISTGPPSDAVSGVVSAADAIPDADVIPDAGVMPDADVMPAADVMPDPVRAGDRMPGVTMTGVCGAASNGWSGRPPGILAAPLALAVKALPTATATTRLIFVERERTKRELIQILGSGVMKTGTHT